MDIPILFDDGLDYYYNDGHDESDDSSMRDDDVYNPTMRQKLADWATAHNIPHSALTPLLSILQTTGMDLPNDTRTLLSTPRNTATRNVVGGDYYYFGIAKSLKYKLEQCGRSVHDETLNGSQLAKMISIFLKCHYHKIYREEAVGLKSLNYTLKITIFVCEIWGNFVKIYYFVNNCLFKVQI